MIWAKSLLSAGSISDIGESCWIVNSESEFCWPSHIIFRYIIQMMMQRLLLLMMLMTTTTEMMLYPFPHVCPWSILSHAWRHYLPAALCNSFCRSALPDYSMIAAVGVISVWPWAWPSHSIRGEDVIVSHVVRLTTTVADQDRRQTLSDVEVTLPSNLRHDVQQFPRVSGSCTLTTTDHRLNRKVAVILLCLTKHRNYSACYSLQYKTFMPSKSNNVHACRT